MDIMIVVQGQAHLLEIVLALGAAGRLARLLHSRQQQGNQDRDDRDHDEQLNQGEPRLPLRQLVRFDLGCDMGFSSWKQSRTKQEPHRSEQAAVDATLPQTSWTLPANLALIAEVRCQTSRTGVPT